jgi:ParB-like chromosome segregation protein Spo0J
VATDGNLAPYKAVPVADLVPYARNARTHSDAQVAQIAASIREYGFTNPILIDGQRGIIAGHGRVLAARKLGLDTVPAIELAHLSAAQKRAYILADNKLALNAGWDSELLALELGDLKAEEFDLDLTGFGPEEIGAFLDPPAAPQSSTKELDPDGYDLGTKCPRCGFEFDEH